MQAIQLVHALVHEIIFWHAPVVNQQTPGPEGFSKPSGSQHALHLSQRSRDVGKVMRRAPTGDEVKCPLAKRQRVDIGQAEAHVAEGAVMRQAFCFRQHLRRQIRTHDVGHVRRERERRVPRASRHKVWYNSSMSTPRIILCLDLDAFYASVEELLHPEWRGLPLLVGGRPDERGVVSSCSYAARKFGVHSAMPMAQALRLCPQAILTPPHFEVYSDTSHRVMAIIRDYGCVMEQVSVDEVFLDATDCIAAWGGADKLASEIKRRLKDELGLPCTIGIASNKLVAKIASTIGKPDGLLRVPAGDEAKFLAPLPIGQLKRPRCTNPLPAPGRQSLDRMSPASSCRPGYQPA